MDDNFKKGIIYCYMFNENKNSYATIGNNIVHEVINLIKDDEGNHYLYIPKDGVVKHKNKVSYVIIVELLGSNKARIKYLAEVEQDELCDNGANLKYGGKTLKEIFLRNSENNGYYANFKVKENRFFKPKSEIILYQPKKDENYPNDEQYCISTTRTQRMFRYLIVDGIDEMIKKAPNDKSEMKLKNIKSDYNKLKSIIVKDKNDFWVNASCDIKTVKDIRNELIAKKYRETTLFNIIGKENDEIAFSNMLAYFFSSDLHLFKEFSNKILNVVIDISNENTKESKLIIEREYEHIDLYINDGTEHIIIENKIKSDINGKKENVSSQLSDYVKKILNGKKDKNGKLIHPSVNKKHTHCFIFVPNYYKFSNEANYYKYNKLADNYEYLTVDVDKDTYEYKVVRYKAIYDFYSSKINEFGDYFKIFLEAMKKHTEETDTDIEDRMKARFIKGIEEARKSSSIDFL